jgi:hypothetical protein
VSSADASTTETRLPGSPDEPVTTGGPSWQDQDGTLRDMWMANNSPQAIADALGRSVPAIMTRAARLGLPRRSAPGRKPGQGTPGMRQTKPRGPKSQTARHTSVTAETATQTSTRICLMCLTNFESLGRHNRICPACKGTSEYQTAFSMPDINITTES